MSCPDCKDIVDLNILTPTEWEFIPGHPFLITQENFNSDTNFHLYVRNIFLEFLNQGISYSDLLRFIDFGSYKTIPINTKCPRCHKILDSLTLCYYGTIAYEYDLLLEELFLEAFRTTYHANGSFLYTSLMELPELIEIFFEKHKVSADKLFLLYSIKHKIPYERGGDPEVLKYAVETIVLGLFSNFLYQLFFQDKVEHLREYIIIKQENYKKQLNNKKILKQLEKFMKNENVEWNKEIALQLINNELEKLITQYIDAIQE